MQVKLSERKLYVSITLCLSKHDHVTSSLLKGVFQQRFVTGRCISFTVCFCHISSGLFYLIDKIILGNVVLKAFKSISLER